MYIPEFFKFGSLISVPLFALIALFLIRQTKNYSLHTHTISQSIKFLTKPSHSLLFRLNFLIKALLDLSFSLYVLYHFNISFTSPSALLLITSSILLGSLAYFIEGKHTKLHIGLVYTSGFLWAVGQILVVLLIGNTFFSLFTIIAILTPVIIGFVFLFLKKTNAFVQAGCVIIWYMWILIFVAQYLR